MPEDRDASLGTLLLDHSGQQGEVVVLKQNDRAFSVRHFFQQGVGKFPVHFLVVLPIVGTEQGTRVSDVAERPQTLIREAIVVALLFLFGEPNPAKSVMRIVGRNRQAVVDIHSIDVGIAGAVGNPGSTAGPEYGFKSSDQTAGRLFHLDRFSLAKV